MIRARYFKHTLKFIRPGGTSRGVLTEKDSWFIILNKGNSIGIGECGLLKGLSFDDRPDYETKLRSVCELINQGEVHDPLELIDFPSIRFGLEMALRSLNAKSPFELFPSEFTEGSGAVVINGLVWMGDEGFMMEQITEKIRLGFKCIKLKIGAIDFETELALLKSIRKKFSSEEIELRVDANGAFGIMEAEDKLKRLSEFDLHSIEQPIKAGLWEDMARLCESNILPIALDEELIGINDLKQKQELVTSVKPQYLVIKPSLVGGFTATDEWIDLARENGIDWWITSALESNVGLNAISQYTFSKNSTLPQGLGTGSLYSNNIDSPLQIEGELLKYNRKKKWDLSLFDVTI